MPRRKSTPIIVQSPRVALLVETSTSYGRELLHGITIYLRENGPWLVQLEQRSIREPPPRWLDGWKVDGMISRLAWPGIAEYARGKGVPAVDLNEQYADLGLPLVFNDQEAIGRMAAEHLLQRGFRQFGYIGQPGGFWSNGRLEGFRETVMAAGYPCHVFQGKGRTVADYRRRVWETELDLVTRWVSNLPRPAGIMSCNAFRALQLLDACRLAQVSVPEQMAVIAGDNEEIACEMATPPLSAVINSAREIGYHAAAMLDALMKGRRLRQTQVFIPPRGIVTRRSTEVTAIDDPLVARSVCFIHERAGLRIGVEDVVAHAEVSRTTLQNRFRQSLDRTVLDVILDARISRAKELLARTTLSLEEVMRRSGFNHFQNFISQFNRRTGVTPGAYRKRVAGRR
jgi:LacI family transcriptional regulator